MTTTLKVNSRCKGCSIYRDSHYKNSFCEIIDKNVPGSICPCSVCVVKMICKVTCPLFDNYLEKIIFKK
jgi:hypothetical protein